MPSLPPLAAAAGGGGGRMAKAVEAAASRRLMLLGTSFLRVSFHVLLFCRATLRSDAVRFESERRKTPHPRLLMDP